MTLKTVARCIKIKGKSDSGAFKGIKLLDNIVFTCDMEPSGRSQNGTYAKYIHCYNERTGGESDLSFNQIERVLKNFEFKELR